MGTICINRTETLLFYSKSIVYFVQTSNILSLILQSVNTSPPKSSMLKGLGLKTTKTCIRTDWKNKFYVIFAVYSQFPARLKSIFFLQLINSSLERLNFLSFGTAPKLRKEEGVFVRDGTAFSHSFKSYPVTKTELTNKKRVFTFLQRVWLFSLQDLGA